MERGAAWIFTAHIPGPPNRKRSVYSLAGFCSAMQQHPAAAPVADYSTAADTGQLSAPEMDA